MRRLGLLFACVVLVMASSPAGAIDLELDPTFSEDGRTFVGGQPSRASDIEQIGGDTFVAGWESTGEAHRIFVTKLDADGEVDIAFGNDGRRAIKVEGKGISFAKLAVATDGRIVIVTQSKTQVVAVRLTADGVVDDSFSDDGRRYLNGGADAIFLPADVAIDSQSRVVVAAMTRTNEGADVKVWRLQFDGSLDTTWSNDGSRTINNNRDGDDWIDTIAVDDNDRVIVGSDHTDSPALVYRFRQNGSLDTSFAEDGEARFRLAPKEWSFPVGIDVNGAGVITVATAGFSDNGLYGSARLLPSGELDRSYGDGGVLTMRCHTPCNPIWGAAESGRAAVILDIRTSESDDRIRIARISRSGTGVQVMSIDPFPGSRSEAFESVEFDGDKTLVAGSGKTRALVVRIP